MALVKKQANSSSTISVNSATSAASLETEAQRKKARTLGKQQVAEWLATDTGQLSSGINEAATAAEKLKRAADQISTGAEQASSAAQKSLSPFILVGDEPYLIIV